MNVIFTVASLLPEAGGPVRSATEICSALAPLGVKVKLVSLDLGRHYGAPLLPRADSVETLLVPCHYSRRLRIVWAPQYKRTLIAQVSRLAGKSGLLHDNGLWQTTNHAAAQVAREFKIPLIISPRGTLEPWALRYRSWKKRPAWHLYQQRDLRAACVLHATSAKEAENLRAIGVRHPIAVIPNGVEEPPIECEMKNEKCKMPHSGGARTVLFLSRVHPGKGLLNLVKAWGQVRPVGWRVIIAGPDEDGHTAEVAASVHAAGLQEQFTFAGPIKGKAKWDLLRQADLFVLPTFSENFGIVIAEALACGVPVITTKGAPWAELISHRCGWWVDVGVEPLANALRTATALSDAGRREMGLRGRCLVEQRYGWEKIATEMRSVYQWVLGAGTKPACVLSG